MRRKVYQKLVLHTSLPCNLTQDHTDETKLTWSAQKILLPELAMVEMERMTLHERQNAVQAGKSRLAEMHPLKAMDLWCG
ncbi:MAG: hypothetical protein AB1457_14220 [Chloroflexota bacterium]